ncbi:DNA-directed RNA polymerases I and III subunit RPAC2-like [Physella acuta]|uniref:DNA-directed RNA polymerases I and III subunit RPAC2-like n=1 Tax=Physella acuta TaxID=109671 RepID=UPI0027DE7BAC|nr:DNA-directed RNA polymerases I and III subunit RPAC2-like [Physella acuta]XP_059170796.1 DNA-directed RNA polymerases I and III subunit RPAC2-like [Physella acuta]
MTHQDSTSKQKPCLELLDARNDGDETCQTFILHDEDHTLGNSLKYMLNKNPDVTFVGYSITHPSENKINLRIQTSGKPAVDVLKQALKDLKQMCSHMLTTFESSTKYYKENHMEVNDMDNQS